MQVLTLAVVLLVAVVTVTSVAMADTEKSVEEVWAEWKNTHNKKYTTPEEEQTRLEIFKDNKKHVEEHNKKYEKGEVTFTMGLNAFSDLTSEEFKSRHTGLSLGALKKEKKAE